jgi:putative Ca2+/H+ antiporter (TMEM165/GDT1 family)
MEALFASFALVAIAEIGDKTQLLSFVLASRFRGRPWPIIAGILVATLLNHALAAAAGDWIAEHIAPATMRWILGLAFIAFAIWALIPDKLEGTEDSPRRGAFLTSATLFFLAEMGDKTQFATIALGAKYASLVAVTAGTTLGMMAANVPAVLLGESLAKRFPVGRVRFVAAGLFAAFGLAAVFGPR